MTASLVTLRPAAADDEPLLRRVYASARADELAPVPWPEEAKTAFLDQQFDAQDVHYHTYYPDASFEVIVVDGEPAGRLYVHRSANELRVMDIALLPQFRGRGVGTGLLRDLLAEAFAAGRRVGLHVEKSNPALRLYQRLGFVVDQDKGVYLYLTWQAPEAPAQGRLHGTAANA